MYLANPGWFRQNRNRTKESGNDRIEARKESDRDKRSRVWKEPKDVGARYAVAHGANRENAAISGYAEGINEQAICDMDKETRGKQIDEI